MCAQGNPSGEATESLQELMESTPVPVVRAQKCERAAMQNAMFELYRCVFLAEYAPSLTFPSRLRKELEAMRKVASRTGYVNFETFWKLLSLMQPRDLHAEPNRY
jgi:hypothetical protein